jgi:hypothetical protein
MIGELLFSEAWSFWHHHQAGRVLVEAVDDARPLDTADAGEARRNGQQAH